MSRSIFCQKLQIEAEGLEKPPFKGSLGEKIFNNISQKAWNLWLNQQTMLINEYRLNVVEAQAREFLKTEMKKFFGFSEVS